MSQSKFSLEHLTRREALLAAATSAGALALGALTPLAALAQKVPQENTDYTRLSPPQPTEHPGKIEVTEFFGFWCPHCNEFEPILVDWEKKQQPDVVMRFIPVAFYDNQVPLQRLFFALKAMGKDEALRSKVFAAIHVTKTPLDTGEQQADWAAQNGIDRKKYLDLYNSFSVQSDARRATSTANAYGVSSIPTLAINGKYTVLGGASTLQTMDYLIAQERRGAK